MNPETELLFAFLEEDNIQRAYFRARPILTVNGDVRAEADRLWPNEGCLRIVPDRNEQHTFKDRMRALGSWCMIDLTGYQPEANKIRTNKNYRPDHGEVNQFILYSDTVKALPETVFYEVLEGEASDFAALAGRSITPRFFIRAGETMLGPVSKAAPEQPSPASEMEATLFALSLPDGAEHTMLCVPAENKVTERPAQPVRPLPAKIAMQQRVPEKAFPAPAVPDEAKAPLVQPAPAPEKPAPAEEESLPIGQSLTILDQTRSFEETLQGLDQPLSTGANLLRSQTASSFAPALESKPASTLTGTPLIRASLHTSTPQPKNKLQEVVSSQVRVVRNDPPAEPLPTGARLTQVDNPVETACQALRHAWHLTESHSQLASFILSLEGMKAYLTPNASSGPRTALQDAIQLQLRDLEAERLSALVQLDKARSDLDLYRKNVLDSASAKAKAELDQLEESKQSVCASIEEMKAELNRLSLQRDELIARLDALQQNVPQVVAKVMADAALTAPMNGLPLRMNPISGMTLKTEQLLSRMEHAAKASGIAYDRNAALALLTVLAVCPRVGLVSSSPAAAATLARNMAGSLGWTSSFVHQTTMEQKAVKASSPADSTPAILLTSLSLFAQLEGVTKLLLARSAVQLVRNPAYEADPWPVYPMPQLGFVPALDKTEMPVSAASLNDLLANPAEDQAVETALLPILAQAVPLSGTAYKAMVRFTAACAGLMDGGLTAACDWAILMWILPALERTPRNISAVKPLLAEYPLSLAAL